MSNTFASVMSSLEPVGWWRLAEVSGTTVVDSSRSQINGTYVGNPALGVRGAIVGDPDTAVAFDESLKTYVEVPDHKIYSLTRAWDDFNRHTPVLGGLSNAWGTTPGGDHWTADVSPGNYYACNGSVALLNSQVASGTWQQGLPTALMDGDLQVRASWDQHATDGPLQPVSLVARRVDNKTFVRAELRENSDHTLDIVLVKKTDGASTKLASAVNVGEYLSVGDWWYLRFQCDGPVLRARAWPRGTPQPLSWQVSATDTSVNAGTIAIRSANSQSAAQPVVSFESFWAQTLGFSIHMWWKATTLTFVGQAAHGTERFCHLFGKGDVAGSIGQHEYVFRFFSSDSPEDPGVFKAYIFNLSGGLGAGARYPLRGQQPLQPGQWYQWIVTFDSGDALDETAGVTLYKDGQLIVDAAPGNGTLYSGLNSNGSSSWQIFPLNGTAPLRFGTRDRKSFFSGTLDEIAIFSRKLTSSEVLQLYNASL